MLRKNLIKRRILAVVTIAALCLSCVIYPYAQDTEAYLAGDSAVTAQDSAIGGSGGSGGGIGGIVGSGSIGGSGGGSGGGSAGTGTAPNVDVIYDENYKDGEAQGDGYLLTSRLVVNDETAPGAYFVSKINNYKEEAASGIAVLAVYNNRGQMAYSETKPFAAPAKGAAELRFQAGPDEYPADSYSYKVYCWDENFVPLTASLAVQEPNIALRRLVMASGAANYDNTGHLATDGIVNSISDFDSSWVSKTNNEEWLYVDLGEVSRISKVRVNWGENSAASYDIQTSNDAKNWTTVKHAYGNPNSGVESSVSAAARYARIYCAEASGPNYIIKELKVFGRNSVEYKLDPLPQPKTDGTQYLTGGNWKLQRASEVIGIGESISVGGFDDEGWLGASVPGTILASYLRAGAIPDPNIDDWQLQVSDSFFTADFWYRNSFQIPSSQRGKRVYLNFDAINWKADVYLNGRLLANSIPNKDKSIEGSFIRGKFDITSYANYGGANYLAVYIYKNDTPGPITLQSLAGAGPNGGPLGADNPTIHAAAGWDWVPTIRGRDTGIYEDVYLSYSGAVELSDPWMITDLDIEPLPLAVNYPNQASGAVVSEQTSGNGLLAVDENPDTGWTGANADNESFTLDLGSSKAVRTIMLLWGGNSASDWDSQYPVRYRMEYSANGTTWTNFGTGTGGIYQGSSGGSNIIYANAAVNLRYLRFTSLERRVVPNIGTLMPTVVNEIYLYNASQTDINNNTVRRYKTDFAKADLTFKTEITNRSAAAETAVISGTINPGNIPFTKEVSLAANETKSVEISGIVINAPKLWWPNTYGEQFLYTADVTVKIGTDVSDRAAFDFGVREYSYPNDVNTLAIYCNGTRIIARGGNWGMDDGMLLNTPEDYDIKVRLHAEENFTMIRNWVGMTNHRAFYDACDKYGVLIWDDFWLANPSDGPNPTNSTMFMENAVDKIKRNRYHAALAVYCGRNESSPPSPLLALLPEAVNTYDGSRYYFPNSAGAPVGSGGGYSLSNPRTYFGTVTNGRTLRSEYGIPNVPSADSIRKIFTEEHLWPINDVWGIHDFCLSSAMNLNSYMNALKNYVNYAGTGVDALGQAYTVDEFAKISQMINYENHKGLFEGLYVGRSNGLLMWMSQSSWPSFVWQTYDYFYDTNGGYFGVKTGNQPVHAVWDARANNNSLVLANATPYDILGAETQAIIYDLNGSVVSDNTYVSDIASDTNKVLATLNFSASPTDIVFIRTIVKKDGKVLGENFYWHNRTTYQAYTALSTLPRTDLSAAVQRATDAANGNRVYSVTLSNNSAVPALMTRIKAVGANTGEQILPVFYEDNYFSMMPGDKKTVQVEFAEKYLKGQEPSFEIEGWNVVEKTIGQAAPDYVIKGLTFVSAQGGVNLWSVRPGDILGKLTLIANKSGNVSFDFNLDVFENGAVFAHKSTPVTMNVTAGQTYTIYSDKASIDLGDLADLSAFAVEAAVYEGGNVIAAQKMNPWIPSWSPLPSLKDSDKTVVNDFDGFANDAALGAQFAMGGSANTAELVPSPFGTGHGNAMKITYNLPDTGLGQYTGRHGTIAAEYGNADTLSFWIQTNGVFRTSKADTGEFLLFQFNSRGQSYELQFAFLAELGIFDARDTGPQFIQVPVSLITPKDSTGYPGAANYSSALFEIGTVGNFGIFLNTSGTVKSPQNAVIYVDDVKFTRSAPVIDSIKRQYAKVGETLNFNVNGRVMDSTGRYAASDDIRYSLVNPPAGASIDPVSGVVTFTSSVRGTQALTVKAEIAGKSSLSYGSSNAGLTATGPHPYVVDNTFTTTVPVTVQ